MSPGKHDRRRALEALQPFGTRRFGRRAGLELGPFAVYDAAALELHDPQRALLEQRAQLGRVVRREAEHPRRAG